MYNANNHPTFAGLVLAWNRHQKVIQEQLYFTTQRTELKKTFNTTHKTQDGLIYIFVVVRDLKAIHHGNKMVVTSQLLLQQGALGHTQVPCTDNRLQYFLVSQQHIATLWNF